MLDFLLAMLQAEDNQHRIVAAQELGKLGDTAAIPALTQALSDASLPVARTAALALGRIGTCAVFPPLLSVLDSENLWLRKAAIQALGEAGCESAVPYLVALLHEPDLYDLIAEALKALHTSADFF